MNVDPSIFENSLSFLASARLICRPLMILGGLNDVKRCSDTYGVRASEDALLLGPIGVPAEVDVVCKRMGNMALVAFCPMSHEKPFRPALVD